jgi:hypothetical protein
MNIEVYLFNIAFVVKTNGIKAKIVKVIFHDFAKAITKADKN